MTSRLAVAAVRVQFKAAAMARALTGGDRTVYVGQRVAEYRRLWASGAQRLGAEFHDIGHAAWEVRKDGRVARLVNHVTEADNPAVLQLAGDKEYCYRLAREAGVPVPDHAVCTLEDLSPALWLLERLPGPFVSKPAFGSASGLGVTTGIRTRRDLFRGVVLASRLGARVLVEAMVPGESWRLLYLDGQLLHAVRRRGLRVTGDGRSTVADLAGEPMDWNARWTLAAQGRGPEDVPPEGDEWLVRGLPPGERRRQELRTIYSESATRLVAPEVAEAVGRVARSLGSELAGIDLIANDLTRPLEESGGMFLEINTTPGIHHHYLGPEDEKDPVAARVLAHLLARPAAHRGRNAP
jgi:cyanophycin synthetase